MLRVEDPAGMGYLCLLAGWLDRIYGLGGGGGGGSGF